MPPLTSAVPNRTLRHLLLATALVFAQQAAQLHALSHLKRDAVMAERGGKCVPPVNHPPSSASRTTRSTAYWGLLRRDRPAPGELAGDSVGRSFSPARCADRIRFARASRPLLVLSLRPVSLFAKRPCSRVPCGASRSHELGETTCTEKQPWRSPLLRRWACPTPRLRRLRTSSGLCASRSGSSINA